MIRQLREHNAAAYFELRQEMLQAAPLAYASSIEDDRARSVEAAAEQLRRTSDSVVFGAFAPTEGESKSERLVGAVGLYRDRHLKSSHKAHIWGMYVRPDFRRQGIGVRLLETALGHAAQMGGIAWVHLTVSEAAPEAQRLYERLGFTVWGTEPDAIRHAGKSAPDHHMALRLDSVDRQ